MSTERNAFQFVKNMARFFLFKSFFLTGEATEAVTQMTTGNYFVDISQH